MVSGSPDPAAQSVDVQQAANTLVKGRFTTPLPGTSGRGGPVFHVTATGVFRQNLAAVRKRESAVFADFPSTGRVWGSSRGFAFDPDLSLLGWRWVCNASRGLATSEVWQLAKAWNNRLEMQRPAGVSQRVCSSSHPEVALLVEAVS